MKKLLFLLCWCFFHQGICQSTWSWGLKVTPIMSTRFLVKDGTTIHGVQFADMSTDYYMEIRNASSEPRLGGTIEYTLTKKLEKIRVTTGLSLQIHRMRDARYVESIGPDMDFNGYFRGLDGGLAYFTFPVGIKVPFIKREKYEFGINMGVWASGFLDGGADYNHVEHEFNKFVFGSRAGLYFDHTIKDNYALSFYLPEISMAISPNANFYYVKEYHYYIGIGVGFSKIFSDDFAENN